MSLPFDSSPPPCTGECETCDLDCELLKKLMDGDAKALRTIEAFRHHHIQAQVDHLDGGLRRCGVRGPKELWDLELELSNVCAYAMGPMLDSQHALAKRCQEIRDKVRRMIRKYGYTGAF
uniref:Uncharacterized protein n=1 Tax=viral metagenome TaxID=1070528 RepID=A0A6M3M810_9ZZZZ